MAAAAPDVTQDNGGSRSLSAARRRACATLALTGLATGCYSWVPARPEALPGGAQAQVRLSLDGTRDLTPVLGPEVRWVRGVVERSTADSLVLQVRELQLIDGQVTSSSGAIVAIARQQLADVERRVPNHAKTVAAVGLAVGAAVIVYVAARPRGSQGEITPPIGGPPAAIVPR